VAETSNSSSEQSPGPDSPTDDDSTVADNTTTGAAGGQSTGSDDDGGAGGESASDGSGGNGGLPAPDNSTEAGLAIGTLLAGGALAARQMGAAAALSAGTGTGGAGSSLLAGIAALLRNWVFRVAALIGYKRFSEDDPLEHERRERLYDAICDSPGTYLAELSDEAGVPMQTARYHLRILEFENLVSHRSIRGRRRYFPVGTDWAELEAALNDDTTAAVIETLADEGPASVSGLADALDRDPSTISHHLDRLESDGLIEREREGRAVLNRLSLDTQQALREDATTPEPPRVSGEAD